MNNIPHIVDSGASVMNNEPVAYGKYIENAKMWLVVELNADMPKGYIPLYTHPVKEQLTDGELEVIRKKAWKVADDATGNCISYSLEFQVIYDREFARAILRKASEK